MYYLFGCAKVVGVSRFATASSSSSFFVLLLFLLLLRLLLLLLLLLTSLHDLHRDICFKGRSCSTYETGTTRAFLHGRTATIRSCTADSVALAEAIASGRASPAELVKKLQVIHDIH